MELENISFEKLLAIYQKFFSLHYLNCDFGDKLACIALTCSITDGLKKKNPKVTCYDVLKKVGADFSEVDKNTFLKSFAAICEDLMYGVSNYPDFGVKPKDAPKTLKKLLSNYVPF